MNDYLNIPFYYLNIQKDIYSATLQEAFQKADLLQYLREVYQSDITLFYNIRDELILRGIEFKDQHQNNVFPALQYEIKHIISTDQPGDNYLDIDNSVTGIQTLVNRYKPESDYFFLNIPLEGLAYFLNKDASFLAKQLERAGFIITPVADFTLKDFSLDKEDSLEKEEEDLEVSPVQDDILIKECFAGREYWAFNDYCHKHKKKYFSQLTIDFIENFQHVRGVGRTKYNRLLEYLEELKEERNITLGQITKPKKIVSMTPMEYFTNNRLKRVLERKQVDYLRFLDEIYVTEEKNIYSTVETEVIKEKCDYVKKLIDEINQEEEERQFLELQVSIKNHPNYPYLMELTKGNVKRLLHLSFDESEDNIHIFEMVENIKYADELSLIYSGLNKFKRVNERIAAMKNLLDERTWEIVISRLVKSLQEIGEQVGLTRERVRQIELKALGKLQQQGKLLYLEIYFNHFLQNDMSMKIEAFMEKLEIDPSFKEIFTICVSQNEHLELKDGVLINKSLHDYVLTQQGEIRGWDKTLLDAAEVLEQFNSEGEYEFTIQSIDKLLDEIGYVRKNSLYFKHTIKLPDQITYLFKHKLTGPLEMTDEGFEYLQELMSEVFNDQFESGKRAAVARIRDTKNVILVDGNTFMYYDLNSVPQELIDQIESAIESALEIEKMVTANTLYQRNLETWKRYNINSHFQLYSILQYHFADVYVIGKGNTLGIFRSNQAKVDIENVLISQLERDGGVLSKKEILDHFKWPAYKLEQLLARSRELIVVEEDRLDGYGVRIFSSFSFTEDELEKLRNFTLDFIEEDYLFPNDLFIEMEFDDELSDILAKRNITNLYTFVSIIKWLFPDLRGFPQLLYLKESEVNSIEQAISQRFDTILRRDELEDFLEEKGYAKSSISSVTASLLEEKLFYNYTAYQYINSKQVDFNDQVMQSLKVYLQKSFKDKSYLPALDLKGYTTDVLPVSSFVWQPQLITAFAQEVGYRYIRTISDYRYNKWILVRDDLNVTNYEELVHFVITNEYEGNFHEREVAKFLAERKLAHNPYQLPIEIKTSKYFVMKDLGFIEVKERNDGVNRSTTTV
ncbi:sigma factor-like helix-turn-helix DNA-binding protein [Neobacillus sp. PS2-9]|uniref:sigma factor-like helix-turn-helix DNA-binding protein n=1 Tax=Neobacillus sp. PS2-9 TaxID=3070676 RepID=UPI0027DEEBAD|nr:sigma factor-like helix-turn-helix DNA-binding protein [Neobacillus sp. PS2-9]WML56029.1 sigma factor-like helix-turn-helix DNA-binding protein [Neobacillus sp. PS2-9]